MGRQQFRGEKYWKERNARFWGSGPYVPYCAPTNWGQGGQLPSEREEQERRREKEARAAARKEEQLQRIRAMEEQRAVSERAVSERQAPAEEQLQRMRAMEEQRAVREQEVRERQAAAEAAEKQVDTERHVAAKAAKKAAKAAKKVAKAAKKAAKAATEAKRKGKVAKAAKKEAKRKRKAVAEVANTFAVGDTKASNLTLFPTSETAQSKPIAKRVRLTAKTSRTVEPENQGAAMAAIKDDSLPLSSNVTQHQEEQPALIAFEHPSGCPTCSASFSDARWSAQKGVYSVKCVGRQKHTFDWYDESWMPERQRQAQIRSVQDALTSLSN